MISIKTVWERITDHEGKVFRLVEGKTYTYKIVGTSLIPFEINQNISKSELEKALTLLPLENTTKLQHLRGPSYIYSILMDQRIRQNDDWGSKS